jgi:hypothetical protein
MKARRKAQLNYQIFRLNVTSGVNNTKKNVKTQGAITISLMYRGIENLSLWTGA